MYSFHILAGSECRAVWRIDSHERSLLVFRLATYVQKFLHILGIFWYSYVYDGILKILAFVLREKLFLNCWTFCWRSRSPHSRLEITELFGMRLYMQSWHVFFSKGHIHLWNVFNGWLFFNIPQFFKAFLACLGFFGMHCRHQIQNEKNDKSSLV